MSKTTLHRVWTERWRKLLPFRDVGQGKRCKVCAKIDEERRQATTAEERAAVAQEKKNHIKAIMADRAVSVRTNRAAEEHSKVPSSGCHFGGQARIETMGQMMQHKTPLPFGG